MRCFYNVKLIKNSGKMIQNNKRGDIEMVLVGGRRFGRNLIIIILFGEI